MGLEGSLERLDIALFLIQLAQGLPQQPTWFGSLGPDEVQDLLLDLNLERSHTLIAIQSKSSSTETG